MSKSRKEIHFSAKILLSTFYFNLARMERIVLGKFVWQKYYGRNLPSKMDEQSPQKNFDNDFGKSMKNEKE